MVPIGGGSTKSVISDRWIVYTKSRKQLLHQKYLLYEAGCTLEKVSKLFYECYKFYSTTRLKLV